MARSTGNASHRWNAQALGRQLRGHAPQMKDPAAVYAALDNPDFFVPDRPGAEAIVQLWDSLAGGWGGDGAWGPLPLHAFVTEPWANARGQMSFLTYLIFFVRSPLFLTDPISLVRTLLCFAYLVFVVRPLLGLCAPQLPRCSGALCHTVPALQHRREAHTRRALTTTGYDHKTPIRTSFRGAPDALTALLAGPRRVTSAQNERIRSQTTVAHCTAQKSRGGSERKDSLTKRRCALHGPEVSPALRTNGYAHKPPFRAAGPRRVTSAQNERIRSQTTGARCRPRSATSAQNEISLQGPEVSRGLAQEAWARVPHLPPLQPPPPPPESAEVSNSLPAWRCKPLVSHVLASLFDRCPWCADRIRQLLERVVPEASEAVLLAAAASDEAADGALKRTVVAQLGPPLLLAPRSAPAAAAALQRIKEHAPKLLRQLFVATYEADPSAVSTILNAVQVRPVFFFLSFRPRFSYGVDTNSLAFSGRHMVTSHNIV